MLVQHQLRWRNCAPVLELPVCGHLCLPVHRGYKVFDFRRKIVTKVITSEINTATVMKEIEGVRNAGLLDFAPTVHGWNVEERWYEEDFINGDRGNIILQSEAGNLLEIYYHHIAPYIENMILLQPPLTTTVGQYLDQAMASLDNVELLNSGLDAKKVESIQCFIKSVTERLRVDSHRQINLVFSHGDFSFVNILRTEKGMMVIDWESVAPRGTLCDFYNYFFTELYYNRVKTNLVAEINDAILSLQSRLSKSVPNISETLLSSAELYRKLYYFERIQVLLEREPSRAILDVITRSIEIFNDYEEFIGNNDPFSLP